MTSAAIHSIPPSTEPMAVRVAALQAAARTLAAEHIGELDDTLAAVAQLCGDIATGGDSYPPGIRELCARLAVNAMLQRSIIASIQMRTSK